MSEELRHAIRDGRSMKAAKAARRTLYDRMCEIARRAKADAAPPPIEGRSK